MLPPVASALLPVLPRCSGAVIIDLDRPYRELIQIGQHSLLELQEGLTCSGP